MRGLMTITRPGDRAARNRPPLLVALVIIAPLLAGAAHAENVTLTTSDTTAPLLTTVVISGSSVYDAPQLFPAYRDQLGQPISRDSARAVVDGIVALYERDGYVKPELALDDSLTASGVLRVQVHEAQITRVSFEGDTGRYRSEFERIGKSLEQTRPLRREQVPGALRELRQLSGVTVTASTQRDTVVRNAFELVVKAEFSPVDGVVRMNNRGTDQVGPAFMLGQFYVNGIGNQGKLGLMWAAATDTDEYLGGGLYFDTAFGAGSRFSALIFSSNSAPNEAPVNLDDEYDRERASLRVWYPLHQQGTTQLSVSAAFDAEDLSIDREGVQIRDDRLRVIETGLRASWRGETAVQYSTNLLLRKGIDGLGAGLQALDLAEDPRRVDFLLWQFSGSVYRRFATDWSVRLDAMSQFSPYVLPDTERFKIGGDRLGRGFEVTEIAGDRGLGGKLELRRDLVNLEGVFGRLSTYGFYDIGAAWKQDEPGRESAATAGIGFALQGASLTGYCEVAAPLTGPDIEGKSDASVFAELSYRF